MSLNDEERQIMVRLEYAKAERFFVQAEKNATIEEWDVVANRIYYSIFHAVVALLIHDQHKVGTHKGAVMMFGQHYVRTGIFSADMGRLYSQLQTMREKAIAAVKLSIVRKKEWIARVEREWAEQELKSILVI